jgi:hypothetical protein
MTFEFSAEDVAKMQELAVEAKSMAGNFKADTEQARSFPRGGLIRVLRAAYEKKNKAKNKAKQEKAQKPKVEKATP